MQDRTVHRKKVLGLMTYAVFLNLLRMQPSAGKCGLHGPARVLHEQAPDSQQWIDEEETSRERPPPPFDEAWQTHRPADPADALAGTLGKREAERESLERTGGIGLGGEDPREHRIRGAGDVGARGQLARRRRERRAEELVREPQADTDAARATERPRAIAKT